MAVDSLKECHKERRIHYHLNVKFESTISKYQSRNMQSLLKVQSFIILVVIRLGKYVKNFSIKPAIYYLSTSSVCELISLSDLSLAH